MSKTVIGIIVAAVVVVGGYFAFSGTKSGDTETASTDGTTENAGRKMAFADLIKQGDAYKCTVTQNVSGTESTGVTYMSDGMIRGEFSTKTQGMVVDSHFIMRDGYTYTWTSAMPTYGFKGKVVAPTGTTGTGETSGQYSWNADQIGDYKCEAWSVDNSQFVLPSTVTFTDYSNIKY